MPLDPDLGPSVDQNVGHLWISEKALDRAETCQGVHSIDDGFGPRERGHVGSDGRRGSRERPTFERHIGLEKVPDDPVGHAHAWSHTLCHPRIQRSPGCGARPTKRAPLVPALGRGRTTPSRGGRTLQAERWYTAGPG
jgi:hypothetical protein